jgi:hypothetical protein
MAEIFLNALEPAPAFLLRIINMCGTSLKNLHWALKSTTRKTPCLELRGIFVVKYAKHLSLDPTKIPRGVLVSLESVFSLKDWCS